MNDSTTSEVLRAVEVVRAYGTRCAVGGVSLSLRAGELLALLGPNGAGKTTLVQMLVGLDTPQDGQVIAPARVGYAPQSLNLWPDLTPVEQLEFLGVMYGCPRREAQQRARVLLRDLGLESRGDDLARVLSGGMQRRLNLALAWIDEPPVVVLDEPTVGLDPHSRKQVHDFLLARVNQGASVLLSTHDLAEAEKLAHRVAVMHGGKLLTVASPAELTQGGTLEDAFVKLTGRPFA